MKKIILFKHFYQYILYHFYFKIAVIVIPQFWTPPQAEDRIYEQPKIPTRLGLALALGLAIKKKNAINNGHYVRRAASCNILGQRMHTARTKSFVRYCWFPKR